jgi:hypothetical protein
MYQYSLNFARPAHLFDDRSDLHEVRARAHDIENFHGTIHNMKTALTILILAQLSAPGSALPQIMSANFKTVAPLKAGSRADIDVSFNLTKGYVINREPEITLSLTAPSGVKLEKTQFKSNPIDPKSKDEYYVDLPTLKVPVTVAKPGKYEVPGKLEYYFCSKADGFCSKQTVNVKIPLQVN